MNDYELSYRAYGNSTILIEWPASIDESILTDILSFRKCIEKAKISDLVEMISAYSSLALCFDQIKNFNLQIDQLKKLYSQRVSILLPETTWQIPVCYEGAHSPDLSGLAERLGLAPAAIVNLHCAEPYTVYFTGFLPGFLYLGGLNPVLHSPRKDVPTPKILRGSVGIGGNQTGVYPVDSPGGWHIIGNTPISFFDKLKTPPSFAQAGEKVKFISIDLEEYETIEEKVKLGSYSLERNA